MRKKIIASVIAMALTGSIMAAETSSSIRGKIVKPNGDAATNVKITITHEPSGTSNEFTTNSNGGFIANGLRVGGPYSITVEYSPKMLK